MTDPEYISTTQAGELLGITRQHVVRLLRAGELEGQLITARSWIVSRASVERLRAARSAAAGEKPEKSR